MVVGIEAVPFVDLRRQHQDVRSQLDAAFDRVVTRGSFTLGEEVEGFEREFASFVGTQEGIGVASGTDALVLALKGLGIGPGDEVITQVNTFAATAEAIVLAGATPVFVDVEADTYLMDPDAAEAAITPRTAAIVPVHLYGQCCDMQRISALAGRRGLKVVEDACQAHGASRFGIRAGQAGDAACFSFYPSKNLGALGDGGFVATNDAALAHRVRLLRSHGEGSDRVHMTVGYTSRLDGLQAAFLRTKLPRLDAWNTMRREAAAVYRELLADSAVGLPAVADGASHVYHVFCVQVDRRDEVRSRLGAQGVQTGIHYARPLHLEPAFRYLGGRPGDYPMAEAAIERILSLPMFPFITTAEVRAVSDGLLGAMA